MTSNCFVSMIDKCVSGEHDLFWNPVESADPTKLDDREELCTKTLRVLSLSHKLLSP